MKDLVQLIRDNPGAVAVIDNDSWALYRVSPDENPHTEGDGMLEMKWDRDNKLATDSNIESLGSGGYGFRQRIRRRYSASFGADSRDKSGVCVMSASSAAAEHLRQMSPHIRERKTARLLEGLLQENAELRQGIDEAILLAATLDENARLREVDEVPAEIANRLTELLEE